MFSLYLDLGFEHITDFKGYDHILFLLALSAVYVLKDWKKALILITAFTIGHSVTLALACLKFVNFSSEIIEFLIPVTIFISALSAFFYRQNLSKNNLHRFKYLLTLFFGLIHGLGFSFYLRALLGNETNIVMPLFAFNIGLEVGQIIIVVSYLIVASIMVKYLSISRKWLIFITAGAALIISTVLIIDRFPI